MSVMTPGFRLGYGPPLPLYNWMQLVLFELFGRSLFSLALLKNFLLGGIYLFTFIAFRQVLPVRSAAITALSLYFVPYLAYEGQRATTHSTVMLFYSALTLAAFFYAARSRAGWPIPSWDWSRCAGGFRNTTIGWSPPEHSDCRAHAPRMARRHPEPPLVAITCAGPGSLAALWLDD